MVKDAPQGIASIDSMLKKLMPMLVADLKIELDNRIDTLKEIAS